MITNKLGQVDTLNYTTFKKLKTKYPSKMILVTDGDFSRPGVYQAFKNHREYIAWRFKEEHIEVYRWNTEYKTLDTNDPKVGLIYLANDSVINPGIEVWALIGHNARYTDDKPKDVLK